jgi:hypothetical protein
MPRTVVLSVNEDWKLFVGQGSFNSLCPPRIDGKRFLALYLNAHAKRMAEIISSNSRLVLITLDTGERFVAHSFRKTFSFHASEKNVI